MSDMNIIVIKHFDQFHIAQLKFITISNELSELRREKKGGELRVGTVLYHLA